MMVLDILLYAGLAFAAGWAGAEVRAFVKELRDGQ